MKTRLGLDVELETSIFVVAIKPHGRWWQPWKRGGSVTLRLEGERTQTLMEGDVLAVNARTTVTR